MSCPHGIALTIDPHGKKINRMVVTSLPYPVCGICQAVSYAGPEMNFFFIKHQ